MFKGFIDRAARPCLQIFFTALGLVLALDATTYAQSASSLQSCLAAKVPGECLVGHVRASRKNEELAWQMPPTHLELVRAALDVLAKSAADDPVSRSQLLLEDAIAIEAAEGAKGVKEKYELVCANVTANDSGHLHLLCSYSELKISLFGNDPKAVIAAAEKVLKAVPGASISNLSGTIDALARLPPNSDEKMYAAEALACYALAQKETDRSSAAEAVTAAMDILENGAKAAQVDLTTVSDVTAIAVAVAPQPWDANADGVNPLPLVRHAASLSELAFGKDNPRLFDVLENLQFHLWHFMQTLPEVELQDEKNRLKNGDSGDPLSDLDKKIGPTFKDIAQENRALLDRLYSLALNDHNAERQEQNLESLAGNVTMVDGMASFVTVILDKRTKLIDEAVQRGDLPVTVHYESVFKRAEIDIGKRESNATALARIDDTSASLAKLDDGAGQLARALLAEVHARVVAVEVGHAASSIQISKAKAALERARSIAPRDASMSKVNAIDFLVAEDEIDRIQKEKK